MDEDPPILFTPLVRRAGEAIPDWLFGPAGLAGLPAPLHPTQGVNVAVGVDIIEVDRVRKVYEHHGERFLKRVFTDMEIRQCRGKVTRLAGRFAVKEAISKALGTGALVQATSEYTPNDPFNLASTYGVQAFDRKLVFNQFIVWQPGWFKGQQGFLGHVLGGWTFAPIFTAGSGAPLYCNTQTDAQAFGSGDGANFFDN